MDNCPVITCEPLKTNWLRQYSLGSLIAALCVALMVIVGLAYKIHRLVTAQTLAQANEDNFANFAANMQNGQENEEHDSIKISITNWCPIKPCLNFIARLQQNW